MEFNTNSNDDQVLKDVIDLISNNQQLSNRLILNTMKINHESEEYWKYVIEMVNIPQDFILENLDNINLKYIIKYQKLNSDILTNNKFLKKISEYDLINLSIKHQKFDENILNYFIINEYIGSDFWDLISQYQQLSNEFINNNSSNLNWRLLSTYQNLSFETIIENLNNINWNYIPLNIISGSIINNDTIKLFENYPIWENIACLKRVTTNILFDNYYDKLNIGAIINLIRFRDLNIDQITKIITGPFKENKELWSHLCENQTLTEKIIDENINFIDWDQLSESFEFTIETLKKYEEYINYKRLSYNNYLDNNMYDYIKEKITTTEKVINIDTEYLEDIFVN